MRRIFYFLLALLPLVSHAQKQNNIWYFGYNAGLNFNYSPPFPLTNGVTHQYEGTASIADKNTGSLLFYTDGDTIWDKTNNVMINGTGLGGNYSSTQSALIVPKPGSNSLYYVFTVDARAGFYTGRDSGLNYNIVDMALNGGLGIVTTRYKLLLTPTTEKLTATTACNGKDIWVLAHQYNTDAFYAYLVSDTGIAEPVISHAGVTYADTIITGSDVIGYIKFSPDGSKLASVSGAETNRVEIFDFNIATGDVAANPITDIYKQAPGYEAYGTSFSPDNSKLYVSFFAATPGIYQYDMLAGDSAAVIASRMLIADSNQHASWGALQNGTDGKMYVAKLHGKTNYLDVIANPNAQGTACNFLSNGLLLGDSGVNYSQLGLPNMIEQYTAPYTATFTYSGCTSTNSFTFKDSLLRGKIIPHWNFGDTTSKAADTSALRFPTHSFSAAGTYNVQLILTNACGADTFSKTVTVTGDISKAVITPQSPSFCAGQGVALTAAGGNSYAWTPSDGLNATGAKQVFANPDITTVYTVVATSTGGCTSGATDTVIIKPAPTASFSYTINDKQVSFNAGSSTGGVSSYSWDFGDNTSLGIGVNPTHAFAAKDTFYVCLTVYNNSNCSYTLCKYVDLLDNVVKNIMAQLSLQLYPNPVNNQLSVTGNGLSGCEMEITDLLGRTLLSQKAVTDQTIITVGTLPTGIYLLEVKSKEEVGILKFIKN